MSLETQQLITIRAFLYFCKDKFKLFQKIFIVDTQVLWLPDFQYHHNEGLMT